MEKQELIEKRFSNNLNDFDKIKLIDEIDLSEVY